MKKTAKKKTAKKKVVKKKSSGAKSEKKLVEKTVIEDLPVRCSMDMVSIKGLRRIQNGLKTISKESLEKLRQSFSTFGIAFPIIVGRTEKNNTYLLDGNHRTQVLELNGATKIPAIVIKAQNLDQIKKYILLYSGDYSHIDQMGAQQMIRSIDVTNDFINSISIKGVDFDAILDASDVPMTHTVDIIFDAKQYKKFIATMKRLKKETGELDENLILDYLRGLLEKMQEDDHNEN